MNFAERFEKLCKEKKEAPSSVGAMLGFSRGTVSKWRSGKCQPRGKTLRRLAEYFGVSVDYLLGKSEIRNPESDYDDITKAKLILFGTEDVPEKAWWEMEQFAERTRRKYHLKKK